LAVLPLSFPYPIILYLKFDLAELPVIVAFMGFGPLVGGVTALVYWLVLTLVGEFTPIGPLMKFAAVGSMLLGIWVGSKLHRGGSLPMLLANFMVFGGLFRIVFMTLANYVVLALLFPQFLDMASEMVRVSTGIAASTQLEALVIVLIFTAVYNGLHTVLSIIPSAVIVEKISNGGVFLRISESWMVKLMARNTEPKVA